jgi:hypothetical protein
MKKHLRILRPAIFLGIGLAFAFIGASFDSIGSSADLGAAALSQTITPTPTLEPVSQVGSTDQILLMGFLIVVIALLPVIFRRSTWRNK